MAERTEHLEAVLLSAVRPSQEQEKRFLAFLAEKYGEGTTLTWQKSDDYPDGFRLEVGAEVYDWSAGGRLSQFKDALEKLAATQGDVIPLLKETVLSWTPQAMAQEVGTVLTVGDGIARVDGLEGAAYGEVLLFDGGVRGMVQDLSEDSVGCILFDDDASVCAGSILKLPASKLLMEEHFVPDETLCNAAGTTIQIRSLKGRIDVLLIRYEKFNRITGML